MKLAYFMDTVVPSTRANTVHIMKMCQAFRGIGVDVTLYCDSDGKDVSDEAIWKQYGIHTPFAIQRVAIPNWIRKYGHRFANFVSARKKLRQMDGCDAAYGRSLYALCGMPEDIPFLYEAHTEPDRINRQFERHLFKKRNFRGLVVISEMLKKRYLTLYPFLDEKSVHVLHDGADLPCDNGETAQLLPLTEENDAAIGYVGHLYPGKCMEILIPLAARCKQWTFHVVGGTDEWIGKWREQCEKQAIGNIRFYGFVENSRVAGYYRAFDICLMPFSKNIYLDKRKSIDIGSWISPLKLFEAMAYEKAILVSRIPSIEEVLTDGENCVMADPENIDDWVQKLQALASAPSERARLGKQAFHLLESSYTWEKRARAVCELING